MAQNDIVIIFDGTGPIDDTKYSVEFKDGFCRQVADSVRWPTYRRGVPGEENEIWASIRPMWDWQIRSTVKDSIQENKRIFDDILSGNFGQKKPRIFLVGYSRGGLCSVLFADFLAAERIEVEAMFLFDAVNMTAKSQCRLPAGLVLPGVMAMEAGQNYIKCVKEEGGFGRKIPDNVKFVYHAMRDPAFGLKYLAEYERLRKRKSEDIPIDDRFWPMPKGSFRSKSLINAESLLNRTRSNPKSAIFDWGNCATEVRSPLKTRFTSKKFMGSHAALGNVLWKPQIFPEDYACRDAVRAWMWPFLVRHEVIACR